MITQAELLHFRELKERAEALKSAVDEDRDALMAREGEEIEPGPLTMRVNLRCVRSFSYEAVASVIGAAEASALKNLIPEKCSKVLTVGKSG